MKKRKKERSQTKIYIYIIAIGVIFIFLMMLTNSILSIGERLRMITKYLEYAFYLLSALIVYILIINPLYIILFSPAFSISITTEKLKLKDRRVFRKVRKNLIKRNIITSEEKVLLKDAQNYRELKQNLNIVYNDSIKKEVTKIILRNAKTAMISTAISQNAKIDLYSVVAINLKMIKEIVYTYGFRPSYKNLAKLTINIFTTALIAEGMENINLEDILPNSTMNTLENIPFIKPVISSFTQGITNALLTLRIGIVCRKYLFNDGKFQTKFEIRTQALKDSLKLLPIVVKDVFTLIPQRFIKLFSRKKVDEELV